MLAVETDTGGVGERLPPFNNPTASDRTGSVTNVLAEYS